MKYNLFKREIGKEDKMVRGKEEENSSNLICTFKITIIKMI
jgi:hypothetical protein